MIKGVVKSPVIFRKLEGTLSKRSEAWESVFAAVGKILNAVIGRFVRVELLSQVPISNSPTSLSQYESIEYCEDALRGDAPLPTWSLLE